MITTVAMFASAAIASAQDTAAPAPQNHFKFYGFIRNYFAYDNRESKAGTGDLYYWLPLDRKLNGEGVDLNAQNQFRFLTLTSRVGVDVSGYKVGNTEFGAKVEADFYAGLDAKGGTAQFRLRQAYMSLKWAKPEATGLKIGLKVGQAWHPMAVDLPDIFSLESGAPFNAFSRTPQITTDFMFNDNWSITASLIWQMQYRSAGPDGASYTYMKYGLVPEAYLGLNYKNGGFLGRLGLDVLSIKPYDTRTVGTTTINVKDRITTTSPYLYLQYTKGLLKLKGKTIYGQAGEHMNLMSGYAVKSMEEADNWTYTPLCTSDTWVTVSYGKKVNGALMLGYIQCFGSAEDVYDDGTGHADKSLIFYNGNGFKNINRMFRIQPEITYNIGKFTLGLEYMLTAVQYGDDKTYNLRGLSTEGLHWIYNNRVQAMVKFTF